MINKIKKRINWVKSTDGLAGLALFFTSVFFFYDLLGGRYILTERDLGSYFIPPRFFWVESLKNGHFPLWNPYQFSGHPFFANPQHAVLYPFNTLFFLLPFDVAFNVIIILHFFLGGLFTYLLLKDLKVNPTGSLLSGLIFMLGGYLLSVHSLLTILLSVIWTPLIMIFFRRAIANPGLKNEIFTAIFITISFLGGGIEIVYGNFFFLIFMMIFPLDPSTGSGGGHGGPPPQRKNDVGDPLCGVLLCGRPQRAAPTGFFRGRMKPLFKGFRSLFIVSILFLFLSAVQMLPFIELFHHSIRGSGISYHEATVWSFAPKDVLLFFLPDAYGYFLDMKKYWVNQCWFKTLYTGGLPFILSLIFFLTPHPTLSPSGERDRVRGFGKGRKLYLALMLFSLFLSLGQYNPLYPYVFKYFPFFNGIRYPVKFLYIFILVLSMTAGLGFQRLTEFSIEGEHRRFKNILIFFSLASGLFLLFSAIGHKAIEQFLQGRGIDFPDFNRLSVNLFHAKRFLFYLTLFFLLLRIGDGVKWKAWAKILLLFFLIADLFGNMGFYGKEKTSDYFKKTKILERISSDKGHFRILSTPKTTSLDTPILVAKASPLDIFKEKHLPSLNLLYRLHDIWGIDVIRLKRTDDLYKIFTSTPSISATNLIDLYGVKYVISAVPIEKDPRFELIYSRLEGLQGKKEDLLKENTIKLYRNRNYFPRACLVKDFRIMDSKAILYTMIDKKFDPRKEVLLEEEPKNPPFSPFSKGGERGITKGGMNELGNKVEFISEKWEVGMGGQHLPAGRQGEPPLQNKIDVGEPLRGVSNEVEFIVEKNNELHLRVRATENALLVLSDTYYPGWKAFVYPVRYDSYNQGTLVDTDLSNRVDGEEVKIYRADYNFRAIPLKPGEYEVKFIYNPFSFKIGMLVSLLTLVGVAVYFIGRPRRIAFRVGGIPLLTPPHLPLI